MDSGPSNILIVDDEPQICTLLGEMLSEQGFTCCPATSAAEAQQLLESREFRLVIMDIQMPGSSGLDLLAWIKRHRPDCKVILMTGASRREYLAQAIVLGAHEYIEKPFGNSELSEVVTRALSVPGREDAGRVGAGRRFAV